MKNRKKLTDKELILAYKKGNQKMFAILVKKWHLYFCKLAFWYVKDADAAKDIAQESWQVILKKIETLETPELFKSWSISIINRKAIDFLRANKKVDDKYKKYYRDNKITNTIDLIEENLELKNKLLKALRKLSVEQQMVVKLFYLESYSLKEISELLDISIGTTKSRLFYAREKLKTILKNK